MKRIKEMMDRNVAQGQEPGGPNEKGSALLIALLIMVVLGILGLTFMVVSDTENAISVNERDNQQVLYIAEAGVGVVKSWFNLPNSTRNQLVPGNNEVDTSRRSGDSDFDGTADLLSANGDNYTGGSRNAIQRLFEQPYRGRDESTFWGFPPDDDGNGPDVVLRNNPDDVANNCSADCIAYLDEINRMFNSDNGNSLEGVRIEEIYVYRPPVAEELTMRLGVATVEVIARKRDRFGNLLAQRTARDVIQEFPYPGPRGAIESAGVISMNGNFTPHWGFVESEDQIEPKDGKTFGGLPRDPDFPNGDDFRKYEDFSAYPLTDPQDSTSGLVQTTPCTPPAGKVNTTLIQELVGGTRNGNNGGSPNPTWVEDPWLVFRTANTFINTCNANDEQPWPWNPGRNIHDADNLMGFPAAAGMKDCMQCTEEGDASNMLQFQAVKFPVMFYPTWKDAAQTGTGSVYYYEPQGEAGGETLFNRNGGGELRKMKHWINTQLDQDGDGFMDNEVGIHFFDTLTKQCPQRSCYGPDAFATDQDFEDFRDSILTGDHTLQKGGGGPPGGPGGPGGGGANNFLAEGFIYINANVIDSTGVAAGVDMYVNMPGEPFLDVGIDLDGDGQICDGNSCCDRNGTTVEQTRCNEWDTIDNNVWDVELDECDPNVAVCDSEARSYPSHANWDPANGGCGVDGCFTTLHSYAHKVVPHANGTGCAGPTDEPCEAPQFLNRNNGNSGGFDMVYPHEPYINFRYPPEDGHDSGGPGNYNKSRKLVNYELAVDYDAENFDSDYARALDFGGCSRTAPCAPDQRTSTGYDSAGGIFQLPLNLHGVMYNEGAFDGRGNLVGFGSLLMRESFRGLGTIHMYFDESLIREEWPPEDWELPRVFSSSRETETNTGLTR